MKSTVAAVFLVFLFSPGPAQAKKPSESMEIPEDLTSSAKEVFDRGVLLFNAKDYKGALENFLKSYKMHAHFKIRYNIGLCYLHLEKFVLAAGEFEALIEENSESLDDELRIAVEKALVSAQAKVGTVAFEVDVEGVRWPCYLRSADRLVLEQVLEQPPDGHEPPPRAAILAPLDNLMWDRRYLKELFGFEYLWEVYKPVVERRWGYYVLPILYGDRFIARFEPGRDKSSEALTIQNWWWEADVQPTAEMHRALRDCFARFLGFLGRERVEIDGQLARQAGLDGLACEQG